MNKQLVSAILSMLVTVALAHGGAAEKPAAAKGKELQGAKPRR